MAADTELWPLRLHGHRRPPGAARAARRRASARRERVARRGDRRAHRHPGRRRRLPDPAGRRRPASRCAPRCTAGSPATSPPRSPTSSTRPGTLLAAGLPGATALTPPSATPNQRAGPGRSTGAAPAAPSFPLRSAVARPHHGDRSRPGAAPIVLTRRRINLIFSRPARRHAHGRPGPDDRVDGDADHRRRARRRLPHGVDDHRLPAGDHARDADLRQVRRPVGPAQPVPDRDRRCSPSRASAPRWRRTSAGWSSGAACRASAAAG